MWVREKDYEEICAYLGVTPNPDLYRKLVRYVADRCNVEREQRGFSAYLSDLRLSRSRLVPLDLLTRFIFPDHPLRRILNAVIALHECNDLGYRQMAAAGPGWFPILTLVREGGRFLLSLLITIPWSAWHYSVYKLEKAWQSKDTLRGKRVLITGVNGGLGKELLFHCLRQGAHVIGTLRTEASRQELERCLPVSASVTLLLADLARADALVSALERAGILPDALDVAILCAGTKYDETSVLDMGKLRETFQVNLFSAVEFAGWFLADTQRIAPTVPTQGINSSPADRFRPRKRLVLVSSMGRWHGMPWTGGYNASKAGLSIWSESLEQELAGTDGSPLEVLIVEPGIFESRMPVRGLGRLLSISSDRVARHILQALAKGKRIIRPPLWFALLTWAICLGGRSLRCRFFRKAVRGRGDDVGRCETSLSDHQCR
ncbi:Short-chain dehydrogenase [Desulfacinum infernum DSM 9756]|uniref:Short-chain dehydrogenase n=1 Tax=Desulfacinum infernum DSM 9756 TaxID=1121391 RepID=A0A1M4WXH2_9BACT|nr:SDR family NAD(P)-dependent oxidoreductase [Desulfacinum infernum]SHE85890.1 Short-chain dehydrogenase [Desulfacinum infernum DSM 9756]